jgi:hypothetical protein
MESRVFKPKMEGCAGFELVRLTTDGALKL